MQINEIISCADAKALGLKNFYTGLPCRNGHVDRRLVCDKSCMACRRIKALKNHFANQEENNRLRRLRRLANIESERETGRNYRAKNIERERDRTRQWFKENPERHAEYVRQNSAKYVMYAIRRKIAKTKATPAWAGEFDDFVMLEAIELCRARKAVTGFSWQVDHMIPMRAKDACGLHVYQNLQVIPASMNAAKKNKMILTERLEWLR